MSDSTNPEDETAEARAEKEERLRLLANAARLASYMANGGVVGGTFDADNPHSYIITENAELYYGDAT